MEFARQSGQNVIYIGIKRDSQASCKNNVRGGRQGEEVKEEELEVEVGCGTS